LLGDDASRMQALFVTVDPKHDQPAVLSRYVRSFDPSLVGLYGDAKAVAPTANEFKIDATPDPLRAMCKSCSPSRCGAATT
jgi:cytochrome oxidase Cu insertion factor (SCO1/SenC/PrrC family)